MQAVATRKRERFGDKYRGIILAVGFFLVLDLTALIMNFYVSSRIEGDAMLINISGRQRMLSQQVARWSASNNAPYTSRFCSSVIASLLRKLPPNPSINRTRPDGRPGELRR